MIGTAADVVVGLVWLAAGGLLLAGRSRRSIGAYMALTGATWLAGSLADALALLHRGPLTQVLLAYPDAGPAGVAARVVVGAAYVDGAVPAVGRAPAATLLLAAAVVAVAAWRCLRTSGAVRRCRIAPAVASAVLTAIWAAGALAGAAQLSRLSLVYDGALIATAIGLYGDLRAGRWSRAAVEGLVVDLGTEAPGTLTGRLARAVGDPSLRVAYALEDGVTFVDEAGSEVELGAEPGRAVTRFGDGERPLAAVAHDAAALRDPQLVAGVAAAVRIAVANARLQSDVRRRMAEVERSQQRLLRASDEQRRRVAAELDAVVIPQLDRAARAVANHDDPELERTAGLALEHDRLHGELRARLAELRDSRAAIVAAGDAERRRLERDLHDGAQQALAGLAMSLGLARAGAPEPHLAVAQDAVRAALAELRALAHRISPAALSDAGPAAAFDVLAEWNPRLEIVRVPQRRFAPAVESAAYFSVAELAGATTGRLVLDARVEGTTLRLDVLAEQAPAALAELEDRVAAVAGDLVVAPAEGGGTLLRIGLPCGS